MKRKTLISELNTPDNICMAHNNLIALLHLRRIGPVEVLAKGGLKGKKKLDRPQFKMV